MSSILVMAIGRCISIATLAACASALVVPTARPACATRRGHACAVPRRGTLKMQKSDEDTASTEGVGKLLNGAQGELLSIGEKVQRGTSSSWVNPACAACQDSNPHITGQCHVSSSTTE